MRKALLLLITFLLCFCLSSCDKILSMAKSAVTGEEVSKPPEDFIATVEGEVYTYELYDEYVKIIEYVGEDLDVQIPEAINDKPVRVIGGLCFFEKPVTSVTIPASVKVIESSAFYYADALKSITIPDTVETIESRAFGWCNSLETVVLGKGITEIPDFCFNHCISLTSFEIPTTITKVGHRAFSYCEKLENVIVPESVQSIGDYAFVNCQALKFVTVENDNVSLGIDVFANSSEVAIVSTENSTSYNYCVEKQLLWTADIHTQPVRLGETPND